MKKKPLWWGVGLLLLLGLVAVGAAWQAGKLGSLAKGVVKDAANADDKTTAAPLEFAAREVVQPRRLPMPQTLMISGPLVAPQSAVLRSRASGTLLSLVVAEGDRVRAGQVLGHVETAEINTRLAERQAQLESARVALAQAERQHASNERLAAQQFISAMALDNSRSALDAARAAMQAAQATLDTTRVALRDAALVAPIAGIVAKRMALPGEKLSIDQPLLSIVDLSQLEVAGSVATHEVSRLSVGMQVQVQVEGVDQAITGRVARIAPAAEPGTRSIGVTISLQNVKERMRAGQYAMVRATLPDDTERLTLPVEAVGNTAGQDHVWLIEGGVLARRAVVVGRRDAQRVEVLQGLQDRHQVLAARFENLREGAQARVMATQPGETDPSGAGHQKAVPAAAGGSAGLSTVSSN